MGHATAWPFLFTQKSVTNLVTKFLKSAECWAFFSHSLNISALRMYGCYASRAGFGEGGITKCLNGKSCSAWQIRARKSKRLRKTGQTCRAEHAIRLPWPTGKDCGGNWMSCSRPYGAVPWRRRKPCRKSYRIGLNARSAGM